MEENELYIASKVEQYRINEKSFIYKFKGIMLGTIDKEKALFMDFRTGRNYRHMINLAIKPDQCTNAYANTILLDQAMNNYSNQPLSQEQALTAFKEAWKDSLYYVAIKNNRPYVVRLNLNEIIEEHRQQVENPNSNQDEMENSLEDLVVDIISGNYNLSELKQIKTDLLNQVVELQSVVDTIDLKVEAIENNEDFHYIKDNKGIDINDIYNKVTKTLIDQDKPARRMIVEIDRMIRKNNCDLGILLTGATGVGKTKLMSLIAKYIKRPFLTVDSTQLTVPGITGRNIEEYLWDLYISCNKDLKKAETAIVFFDEIDKKGSKNKSDVSGQGVLNILLKFIEGTTYTACENPQFIRPETTVKIKTNNMIVIVGGAFTDVYKKISNKKMGFVTDSKEEARKEEPTIEDFVTKAMMTNEFMGRAAIIIKMNDLNIDSMKKILLESDESPLKSEQNSFRELGIKLEVTDGYLDVVAKEAIDKKTGARGLKRTVLDSTWEAYDEVKMNLGVYDSVIISEETVEDSSNYQLVKRTNN